MPMMIELTCSRNRGNVNKWIISEKNVRQQVDGVEQKN